MTEDPAGYYAALGVDPAATPETIVAAFRRRARLLHPDVPETGDAAAFIRVRQAYEVLGDASRRAAYDRQLRSLSFAARAPADRPAPRHKVRPLAFWVGLGGFGCVGLVMAALQFDNTPVVAPGPIAEPPVATSLPQNQAVMIAGGPATHYVLPTGGETVLWRYDAKRDAYVPAGHIAAFTPVQALRLVPQHGLVEIGLADGRGYVDAKRLTPGDAAASRRAYCAYEAGPAPSSGEVLRQHGDGPAQLQISNRSALPAVVKLRDRTGRATATVFVAPGDSTTVHDLPDRIYQLEFAVGDLWSRACNSFAAGMRAQRLPGYAWLSGLSPLTIPPDLSDGVAPEDIPDEVFEHE
jgi:hypothetical protein